MKMLSILRFVLLAGILSSAIAGDRYVLHKNQTVPSHLHLLGFKNITHADVEKFDEEMCRKNGGPSAHADNEIMQTRSVLCVTGVYSSGIIEDDGNVDLEKLCQAVPSFENCLKNLTKSLKTCLEPEKQKNVDIGYNTVDSVAKFLCEDNAARLKDFMKHIDDFASSCLRSKERAIQECANNTIINYIKSTVSNGASIGGIGAVHLLEPDLDKCIVLEKFQHCLVGLFDECEPSKFTDLANSILNLVKKVTTCDNFLKP